MYASATTTREARDLESKKARKDATLAAGLQTRTYRPTYRRRTQKNVQTANTRQKNHRPIPSKCSHRMKSFAWKFTWWITIWYWMYSQWTIRSADYFNTIQFYGLMNGIIWWLKYHIKQCWVGILVVDSWHHIEYSEEGRGLGETHKASIYVRSMNNNCN